MRLVVAAHLENSFKITAQAWFAFLVLRVPASLAALLARRLAELHPDRRSGSAGLRIVAGVDAALQTTTLQNAVSRAALSKKPSRRQIADIVGQLQAIRQSNVLGNPYQAGKTTLGQLLNAAGLAPAKQ